VSTLLVTVTDRRSPVGTAAGRGQVTVSVIGTPGLSVVTPTTTAQFSGGIVRVAGGKFFTTPGIEPGEVTLDDTTKWGAGTTGFLYVPTGGVYFEMMSQDDVLSELGGISQSTRNQANGFAGLGDDAKLFTAQLPAHTHTVSQLSDATATGQALAKAVDAAAGRAAIGAAAAAGPRLTGTIEISEAPPPARAATLWFFNAGGSLSIGRTDSPSQSIGFVVNTGDTNINATGRLIISGGSALTLSGGMGGGVRQIDMGRRNDLAAGVGAEVRIWTVTGQSVPALAILAPGGGSTVASISAGGDLSIRSIAASGGLGLAPITRAALLALTPNGATGGRWRVTDSTPPQREAYPDGTVWRYVSDDLQVT
jgi:hypothetical protein